jgi:ubiquinone/menaquinone biosynthesis C-methylase UbiE
MAKLSDSDLWDLYQTELREIYDRKVSEKPIYPLFHLIKQYYKKKSVPASIAEIGFGNGGLLRSLAAISPVCYGLDISKKNIDFTEKAFRQDGICNVQFEVYNIIDSPRVLHRFDAIVLSHVLEHFDDSQLNIVLQNIKKMLNKQGTIFGATPYKKPYNPRICQSCGHMFEIDGHKQIFGEEKMKEILEKNGFKVLLIRHFNPDHFYYGKSFLWRFFHRLFFLKDQVTQLEFIASL